MIDHTQLPGFKEAMNTIEVNVADENERHRIRLEHINSMRDCVGHILAQYVKTGVFFVERLNANRLAEARINIFAIGKDTAAKLKRPYLKTEKAHRAVYVPGRGYSQNYAVELRVPSSKRMESVVGPLLVVAEKVDELQPRGALVQLLNARSGSWRFYFVGDEGRNIFDSFVERCHTDPATRIMLNL